MTWRGAVDEAVCRFCTQGVKYRVSGFRLRTGEWAWRVGPTRPPVRPTRPAATTRRVLDPILRPAVVSG